MDAESVYDTEPSRQSNNNEIPTPNPPESTLDSI